MEPIVAHGWVLRSPAASPTALPASEVTVTSKGPAPPGAW